MSAAPPPVLDCLAFASAAALRDAAGALSGDGADVLAVETCQRYELFRLGESRATWPEGARHVCAQADAAARLFLLAAGALSDIPGERAVAHQVRAALRAARRPGLIGPRLDRLTQRALRMGATLRERVETTTPIIELADLVAARVASDMASGLGGASGRGEVLLLGAGPVARSVRAALRAAGIDVTRWATRRPAAHRGTTMRLDAVAPHLPRCRVLVAALGAGGPIDTSTLPADAISIDLGVPASLAAARWTLATVIEDAAERLEPQREALRRAAHRVPALAESALAETIAPSIAATADAIVRFRQGIVDAELKRLDALLTGLPPETADRVRRALRHAAARCMHPLHEYVNQLGRQHRVDEAVAIVDHLLGSRVGFVEASDEAHRPRRQDAKGPPWTKRRSDEGRTEGVRER